jgi:hypothetical protein
MKTLQLFNRPTPLVPSPRQIGTFHILKIELKFQVQARMNSPTLLIAIPIFIIQSASLREWVQLVGTLESIQAQALMFLLSTSAKMALM